MTFTYKFLFFEVVLSPWSPEGFPEYVASHKGISIITNVDGCFSITPKRVETRVTEYLETKFNGLQTEDDIAAFINHQLGLNAVNSFEQPVLWKELVWIQSVMNEYQEYQLT